MSSGKSWRSTSTSLVATRDNPYSSSSSPSTPKYKQSYSKSCPISMRTHRNYSSKSLKLFILHSTFRFLNISVNLPTCRDGWSFWLVSSMLQPILYPRKVKTSWLTSTSEYFHYTVMTTMMVRLGKDGPISLESDMLKNYNNLSINSSSAESAINRS